MARVDQWTRLVTRVLAPNPGPMTLDGTNSLVIRHPRSRAGVVVDPGPNDEHIDTLLGRGPIELILLTHHHLDHTEAAVRFSAVTGAPVRASDPALCLGAPALGDGEVIVAGGTRIEVVSTPGHTADSTSYFLDDDEARPGGRAGSMITGDTILGRGTTVIARPDGLLAAYLASLNRLAAFGAVSVLPAHGPMLDDLAATCGRYTAHRLARLDAVRAVLRERGLEATSAPATVAAVVRAVYSDISPDARYAAESSALSQLEYLAGETD